MQRVQKQLSSLNATNLRINQEAAGQLRQLLSHGMKQLQGLFEAIVSEDSKTVEPLHFITKRRSNPCRYGSMLNHDRDPVPYDSSR